MTLKHTPGPWSEQLGSIFAQPHGRWRIIAGVYELDKEDGDPRHNGLLIAAAPDMLEALIKLYHWMQRTEYDISLVWMTKVGHLIESATGKSIEDVLKEEV